VERFRRAAWSRGLSVGLLQGIDDRLAVLLLQFVSREERSLRTKEGAVTVICRVVRTEMTFLGITTQPEVRAVNKRVSLVQRFDLRADLNQRDLSPPARPMMYLTGILKVMGSSSNASR
jgi:hypothetical protein